MLSDQSYCTAALVPAAKHAVDRADGAARVTWLPSSGETGDEVSVPAIGGSAVHAVAVTVTNASGETWACESVTVTAIRNEPARSGEKVGAAAAGSESIAPLSEGAETIFHR